MSVQAVSWVLDHSTSKGNERCVLIALANRFDAKEPGRCWPGVDTIAAESNVSTRTVTRCLDGLVALGELLVYPKLGGSEGLRADRRPNLYVLPALTEWRPDPTKCHPVRPDSSRAHDPTDSTSRPDRSRADDLTLLSSDTTMIPTETLTSETKSSNAVARLDAWADDLPAVVRDAGLLDDARELCALLEQTLVERGYRNAIGKARSKRWLLDMEALLRIDERKPQQVRWVIGWLHEGADRVSLFWRANVRSPDKLRLQWDVMREQYHALSKSQQTLDEDAHARKLGLDPDESRDATTQLVRDLFGPKTASDSGLISDVLDVDSRGA